ncbi:hypothetical protein BU116_01785 [Staphylococcus xylosus]|uniref:hypothetical protein n=1 Tax=Staphylococcus TaxID=1279 RepID=UPI000E67E3EB|nr:hypothetical protein [Staphylococcus xylosus]RIM79788.1 hypothetical protein BU116_01785 [Staphylococcus xylosus]
MLHRSIDKRDQYEMISISKLVLNNYLLRKVDVILDLNFVYEFVKVKNCLANSRVSIGQLF